jgi:hypothetical protein
MSLTIEDVKAMIRARIDEKREQDALEASRRPGMSEEDEMCRLRHWSDVHLHNQVLRRLLADIEVAEQG